MNPILSRTAVWLVAGLCTGTTLRAQSTEVQNDFRNIHSLQPSLSWPPPAPGLDDPTGDLVPSPHQWRSLTTLGGWISTRTTVGATVTAGAVNGATGATGGLVLPSAQPANGLPGVKLVASTMGRPLVARQPTVFFGDEIGRPDKDAFGAPLVDPKAYYLAQPAVLSSNFYFSTDAQVVFATQAGTVSVVWNLRAPTNGVSSVTNTYFVSGSANPQRGGAKRIYWTEMGYSGPKVGIPVGPIALIKVVHNNQVPEQVPSGQEFESPYIYPGHPLEDQVPRGTIWYSDLDKSLHAFNREGQVFIELLGAKDNETGRRQHLGSEVVQVIREVSPAAVTLHVGDRIAPHQQETPALIPRVINGDTTGFVYAHGVPSRDEVQYYATRTTSPTVPAGRPTGEILFYWMRQGQLDIEWPHLYNTYVSIWPEEGEQYYTRYVRPSGAGDSLATSILFDGANTSALVFQDDPSGQHAQVEGGNRFYTNVSTNNPTGLALIRHTNGESIWFERVWSTLDTLSPGFTNAIEAVVGQRVNPPSGHEAAIGYIHQPTGTAFDPTAYINPFVAGVDAARLGAILPVNAREGHNELEVWWYKKNTPPAGSTVKPLHVPVLASTYITVWPTNTAKIVLASNEGTGDLPSLQGAGSIYFQNDSTQPGFNPNDEHALMLAGRAYALRDDLGTDATSLPYVLLRYTEADGRPAMRVFQVEREDTENGIGFLYDVEAGRVLQAPMPIPLLGKVYNNKELASQEVKPAKVLSPANNKAPAHYSTFTTVDRKGTIWLYRGPHDESSTNETFSVQYFYPSQNGFYLPGVSLANQPKPGDAMPYLRNLKDGAYQGAASGLSASPALVTYRPRWPRNAPVLLLGETLTTPTRGLPAVRGQTSLEILYDQSTAAEAEASSVTLIDPTVAKKSKLEDADLDTLPSSIFTSPFNGRIYFPNLPPHLAERVYVDPNEGSKGALVLIGQFKDEVFGDDYLLLNVLSDKDLSDVNKLCNADDSDYSKWTNLVASLSVEMRAIEESTEKQGTYVPVAAANALKTTNIWTYIQNRDWANNRAVPSASDVRSGATLNASADVTSAMQWMRDNFSALVDLKIKFSATNPAERQLVNLKTLFTTHTTSKNPEPQYVRNYFEPTRWLYPTRANEHNAKWAEYDRKKTAFEKIGDWVFATNRLWSTTGEALTELDLQATDIPDASENAQDKAQAWQFVTAKRDMLQEWDEGRQNPTPQGAAWAELRTDFEKNEISSLVGVGPQDAAVVTSTTVPVDSYALSAVEGQEGWVVLRSGQGRPLTPEAEPVSLHIIRVAKPLGAGQLKVIAAANPLSEKLTLQHSLDFAAKPDLYDFEWRTIPAGSPSLPTAYTFVAQSLLAGTSWSVTNATLAADTNTPVGTVGLPARLLVSRATNVFTRLDKTFLSTPPYRAFVSLELDTFDGAQVLLNDVPVASLRMPGEADTGTASPPLPSFNPLTHVFEVPGSLFKEAGETNQLSVVLTSTADANAGTLIDVRFEAMFETDVTGSWTAVPAETVKGEVAGALNGSVKSRNRYVVEGNSIFTLTDNWFICRYRPNTANHSFYASNGGWSRWTEPQLAEGWIKRALAGINPFEQRIKDLFNNDVNTDVSLVTQAGKRWEGDVALNLANIDDYGLIEIYETILRRGKSLSIEGAPPINYGPANDALLLAAGYLNDLYVILGNEAYADAVNPTIAFSTDGGDFGDVSTSLFAFKGQLATVLDEELSLMRGRDDFLFPGSKARPVFNRLVWNYTRGIDSGEAIYALNYNLKDLNTDGDVNAADAARAFPQGHGDAYGHYLTALAGYYSLLWNANFSWNPRAEEVLVLGQAVSVDYMDERKFAGTAAAWSRTAAQTLELTYRAAYNPASGAAGSWDHLRDGKTNSSTGLRREWGVDDWAARGGQGTYFHWLTANSMLPETDPNPLHEGIQKVDRSTVPEISEIAQQAEMIQRSLDSAGVGLNPLGLSQGAVSFDISPTEIDQGRTHFEQIYARAVAALSNAAAAFNNAKSATRLLRSQEDSLEERREAIFAQERAFENQLKELYGTPYADDIGPGKTYSQGYSGPDLIHYAYTDFPELLKNSREDGLSTTTFRLVTSPDFGKALDKGLDWLNFNASTGQHYDDSYFFDNAKRIELIRNEGTVDLGDQMSGTDQSPLGILVDYTFDVNGDFHKPMAWTGRRGQPGQIQQAISQAMSTRLNLHNALEDYNDFARDAGRLFRSFYSAVRAHEKTRQLYLDRWAIDGTFEGALAFLESLNSFWDEEIKFTEGVNRASREAFPRMVGVASDVTFAARAALLVADSTHDVLAFSAEGLISTIIQGLQLAHANVARENDLQQIDVDWNAEHLQLLSDLKAGWEELEDGSRRLDLALRAHQDAQDRVRSLVAQGNALQDERAAFRRRSAAIIRGYRTRDYGFRAFRNESLESYKSLFDLASRYTYLAARAYDYETGLVDAESSATATAFYQSIVRSRALGVIAAGVPQPAGAEGGDPGLSGALARMNSDWAVAKSRFGFNNPDRYRTSFSLRRELARIRPGATFDGDWKVFLGGKFMADIQQDPDVKKLCMNINAGGALAVPGLVIDFRTTINTGFNFFGHPLAGGDSTYSPSSFATKIRTAGLAFPGYVGMASPTTLGGSLSGTGSTSPLDPGAAYGDPNGLSATPYIYLIPAGDDSIRAPIPSDLNVVRTWKIEDQAIPLPFDIGGAFSATNPGALQSLTETYTLRKHQAFRAVPDGTVFSSAPGFTNARLVGRSVWNSKWKIVIPGSTLRANPTSGLESFQNTVKDIILYFESYSHAGN